MVTYEDITRMRKAIVEYGNQFKDTELRKKRLDDLLPALSAAMERPVTAQELPALMYQNFDDLTRRGILDRDLAHVLDYHIRKEEAALDRVAHLVDIDVRHVDVSQLEEAALKMMTLSPREYGVLTAERGLENEGGESDLNAWLDSTILFGLVKARGHELPVQEVREKLLARDSGVGYFRGMFESEFGFMTRDDGGVTGRGEGIDGVRDEYHRAKEGQGKRLKRHEAFDAQLRTRNLTSPPKLLSDKTIDFTLSEFTPLALAFLSDQRLAVLVKPEDSEDDIRQHEYADMVLYLIRTDTLPTYSGRTIETGMKALFDGAVGTTSFEGSLSIGSDGTLYVVGANARQNKMVKRYTPNLQEITETEDKFNRAIQLLKAEDILQYPREISQVTEQDGVFYFNLSPNNAIERSHNNIIAASNGQQIIGTPIRYHPWSGGIKTSEWSDGSRIVIDGKRLYFKAANIMAVDRRLGQLTESQKPFPLIDPKEIERRCLPMNHSIHNGVLYALTKMPDEEVGSIKAYRLPTERGEPGTFLSHFYPENYQGNAETVRTMAISRGGLLAYSDVQGKKVHVYQIEK
ncbi:MAG: hypothetical protein Q7R76_02855 [Candidatus Woesearchaeota archaeon]|nr:hypothetical protein [Candidatus Woesearchaeota archaeon]